MSERASERRIVRAPHRERARALHRGLHARRQAPAVAGPPPLPEKPARKARAHERAEAFSRRGGYAASTLRWWASKLKRDMATSTAAPPAASWVTLARVVRTSTPAVASAPAMAPADTSRAIVLEGNTSRCPVLTRTA